MPSKNMMDGTSMGMARAPPSPALTAVRFCEPVVAAFAAMEQLDAHGRSVKIRTVKK